MALTLNDVIAPTLNKYHLKQIAGKNGLNKIFNWVYTSEDLNTADFLLGGELVITTGINTVSSDSWLYKFVKNMIDHNTCGVILNTGKYIKEKDIPDKLIQLCDENNFALFTMPWKIHIYDISKDYCDRIFTDAQEDSTIANAFLNVIHHNADYSKSINILEDNGYSISNDYCVCIMNTSDKIADNKFSFLVNSLIKSENINSCYITRKASVIFIFENENEPRIRSFMHELINCMHTSFKADDISIGVGSTIKSLSRLHLCYAQADAALKMAHYKKTDISNYDDLGFFKLLLSINDSALLEKYINDNIGSVIEYDKKHDSSYAQTLYQYIINDGSVQAIASALYCHRNTINYRIRVLRENFNLNLDDAMQRFNILTAFLIQTYLDIINF